MPEPLSFFHGPLSERFDRIEVEIPPGGRRPYDAAEWRDALVLVESGEIELECTRGGRRRFAAGAVLPLAWLPLRALHNAGPVAVRLTGLARGAPPGR